MRIDKLKEELETIRLVITSLEYSVERIQNYPHQEYQWKLDSLKPVKAALEKQRQKRDEIKQKIKELNKK